MGVRFEHRSHPLLPRTAFYVRLLRMAGIATLLMIPALGLGVIGYHYLESLPWIDALLNAAMLLGGMGPVNAPQTTAGKLFASFYALFSGVLFLTVAALLFAPLLHRMIHRFHLELDDEDEDKPASRR